MGTLMTYFSTLAAAIVVIAVTAFTPDAQVPAAKEAMIGFTNQGLKTGAMYWFGFGVLATIVAQGMVCKETPNITMQESRKLGMVVVWVSTICMWLLWSFVYMHQMLPIIYPIHVKEL